MAVTRLSFGRDIQGYNAYAPLDSSIKYSAVLTSGAATSIVVPSSYKEWIVAFSFQPGTTVWVDISGTTAIAPVSSLLQPTKSTLNPGQRTVFAGNTISVVTSTTTAEVGIELWPVSY